MSHRLAKEVVGTPTIRQPTLFAFCVDRHVTAVDRFIKSNSEQDYEDMYETLANMMATATSRRGRDAAWDLMVGFQSADPNPAVDDDVREWMQ